MLRYSRISHQEIPFSDLIFSPKSKKIKLENIIYYKNNNIFMTDECNLEHIQMHFMIQFLHLILTNNQMHYTARTMKLLNSSFYLWLHRIISRVESIILILFMTLLVLEKLWRKIYSNIILNIFSIFIFYYRGILYQNQQMYEDAVGSLQKAIYFRPSLARKYQYIFSR